MPGSTAFYPRKGRTRPEEWRRLKRIALALVDDGWQVREAAHEVQVSENTISQWRTRAKTTPPDTRPTCRNGHEAKALESGLCAGCTVESL